MISTLSTSTISILYNKEEKTSTDYSEYNGQEYYGVIYKTDDNYMYVNFLNHHNHEFRVYINDIKKKTPGITSKRSRNSINNYLLAPNVMFTLDEEIVKILFKNNTLLITCHNDKYKANICFLYLLPNNLLTDRFPRK
jgi:hypothetical protein